MFTLVPHSHGYCLMKFSNFFLSLLKKIWNENECWKFSIYYPSNPFSAPPCPRPWEAGLSPIVASPTQPCFLASGWVRPMGDNDGTLREKWGYFSSVCFLLGLCWRRLLRVPRTARKSNQSDLKEINPEFSLEKLMLKLKLQYFSHLMWRTDSLEKTLTEAGKDRKQEEKGMTEAEMVGWHHWLNWHEFDQASGDSEGQGSLVCCSPRGSKKSDTTERLKEGRAVLLWQRLCPSMTPVPTGWHSSNSNGVPVTLSFQSLVGYEYLPAILVP